MTISDIGEFGLINRIHRLIEQESIQNPAVTLGIGDDTASILPRAGYELLITCDSLVEGRHYLPEHTNAFDMGRRAMTVNISDIGAMGGWPLFALASLGLKPDTRVEDVESMYHGFIRELMPFGASIIGGNVTKVDCADFIDITLIGEVKQGKLVRRSGAEEGDAILVTGNPGQAAADNNDIVIVFTSLEEIARHRFQYPIDWSLRDKLARYVTVHRLPSANCSHPHRPRLARVLC